MKEKTTILFLLFFTFIVNNTNAENYKSNLIAPANDECSTATEITVNSDFLCTNTISGTVEDATQSSQAVSCTGQDSQINDDVWFKFIATDTSHKIELLNISGSFTNMYHAIYDGGVTGDCGALSIVLCSDPNSSTPTGLTVGNTYFVRVFTNDTGSHTTTFDICVGTMPVAPANDECTTAEAITSIPFSNTVDATTATNNAGFIDVSGCGGAMNDGVWYTITGDGNTLSVVVIPTAWDVKIGVYEGSCGTFTCVGEANIGISGTAEEVEFNSTLGTTYYVNIGHPDGVADMPEGIFNINVTTTVLSIDDLVTKGFAYYPNPVKDKLKINANELIKSLTIYNSLGQKLKTIQPSAFKTSLDFSNLPTGTYFVKAQVDNSVGSFKIVKE